MCGIQFWNGYENLRPVYKNHFRNIERFLPFLTCKFSKSTIFIVPSKRRKLFFFKMANGILKNPSFHTGTRTGLKIVN
jgi:hypothetical protein